MWSLADPFFRHDFLKDLARRATAPSKEVATIYANPDNVKRITNLSLYQPVIYSVTTVAPCPQEAVII